MSTILWFTGFTLMMISFTFLVRGGDDEPKRPRISVEPWFPAGDK